MTAVQQYLATGRRKTAVARVFMKAGKGGIVVNGKPVDEFFTEQKGINPFVGRNALFLGSELPQTIRGAFADVRSLRQIQLPNGGQLTVFLCLDYQTLPL